MSLYGSAFAQQAGRGISAGAYTAVTADDTANAAIINTGLGSIDAMMVEVLRSDVKVTADAIITKAAGKITVADGASTYDVTAGDVIHWFAWGRRRQA